MDTDQSIEDTWYRVAKWAAQVDGWSETYYGLLSDFKFIPGGRITHAAGQEGVTAMNCFVGRLPEDSRDGILNSIREEVETMARGGGFGVNMSSLRPRGYPVLGVNGTSSGPVPWMQAYSTMSKDVVQQGGTRRGALMLILDVSHPDVWEFINAKTFAGKLEGANVSVGISNAFMEAVANDEPWNFTWKGEVHSQMGARHLWRRIAEAAHASGEPGVVFMDRCNEYNNLWYRKDKQIVCVNPCSEIPLPEYGSCLLGTFNLERYTVDEFGFNWNELSADIATAVRFLDNVIDLSYYPLPEYKKHQQEVRQMAIGYTGVADALIKLKIRYGSDEAIEFIDNVYGFLATEAYKASVGLAKERGPFPLFDQDMFCVGSFVNQLPTELIRSIKDYGIRNSFLVGQQPSGTGSLLAGVNSGIEPVFSFDTIRTDRTGEHRPNSVSNDLYNTHSEGSYRFGEFQEVPEYFVTAHELTPTEHILMQAAAQKWCDQAISKTVNCPNDWTVTDVEDIFNFAWQQNLKSVAVYRDGSRTEQVLHDGEVKNGFSMPVMDMSMYANDPNCRSGQCEI